MAKGDHVFNNVVAKLTKAFKAGLVTYVQLLEAKERQKGRWEKVKDLVEAGEPRDIWIQKHMPRTWAALHHFKEHPDLVARRDKLQTARHEGGDVNTPAYSDAGKLFEDEVKSFFKKLAERRVPIEANELLPDISRVRRAFFHMTRAAEDPGATARLLEEYRSRPREMEQVEREMEQVRESLEWAWGRCELLFRMVTQELLRV